jgi:putative cell wall-binding protein
MTPRFGSFLTVAAVAIAGVLIASPVSDTDASILTDADDQESVPDLVGGLPVLVPLPSGFASALNPGGETPNTGGGGGGSTTTPGAALPGVPLSLAGADRVATSIAVAEADFEAAGTGVATRSTKLVARAAVLASSTSFPDALTAGPLAFDKVAPLLLNGRDSLDSRVSNALTKLVPRTAPVYLVGGEAAIGASVESAIEALGYTVTRLAGVDRYETSVIVARDGLDSPKTVFVATGLAFPDALAAGAVAARRGGAILLSRGEELSASVETYLLSTAGIVTHAVGGPAVRALVAAKIASTAHQGSDRYATAARLASAFAPTGGIVGAASGDTFPDGLVAAPYLARRNGVLLLVRSSSVPTATASYLQGASGVNTVQVFGGLSVVGDATRRGLSDLL